MSTVLARHPKRLRLTGKRMLDKDEGEHIERATI